MTIELIVAAIGGLLVLLSVGFFIYRKMPHRLKTNKFTLKWKRLQEYCKDKNTWSNALIDADKLLEKALRMRKYKGKSVGEMMVSAQKVFTDNDGIWFAHNLYKKVLSGEVKRIREEDIKEALVAYRQALRDLGALRQ
ncbi:hypothetical protein KDA00_01610 [Candidatus Saccharibacteria bacterium]|nr:hypothetical protein [Candidatus Saccharibacteria bacterium]